MCCNKIILHRCENDRLNSLRDMDMTEHIPASIRTDEYILHLHMYNLQDMRLRDIIVCLSFIGLKAHVMGEYLSVQQCVWPRARSQ